MILIYSFGNLLHLHLLLIYLHVDDFNLNVLYALLIIIIFLLLLLLTAVKIASSVLWANGVDYCAEKQHANIEGKEDSCNNYDAHLVTHH